MNQEDKLIERIKKDTIFDTFPESSIGFDTKLEIIQLIHKRRVNNITQIDMSNMCSIGVATIKRFELLKVDSLVLFNKYRYFLGHLNNKKKPNWI